MIYDVTHLTRYRYGAPVVVNDCVLRLRPRDEPGQKVTDFRIEAQPGARDWSEHDDAFNNCVVRLRIQTSHTEMSIKSKSRVEVARAAPPEREPASTL